jgi:hypothetical protein
MRLEAVRNVFKLVTTQLFLLSLISMLSVLLTIVVYIM